MAEWQFLGITISDVPASTRNAILIPDVNITGRAGWFQPDWRQTNSLRSVSGPALFAFKLDITHEKTVEYLILRNCSGVESLYYCAATV